MELKLSKGKYVVHGQPIVSVPDIYQLIYDDLGIEVIRIMNEIFEGYELIELDISDHKKNQPIQPIGSSNPYRRGGYRICFGKNWCQK